MRYDAQHRLSDPARARAEIWRTALGLVVLGAGTLALTALWLFAVPSGLIGGSAQGMILILSSFLCPLVVLWLIMHLLHGRSMLSLIGPRDAAIGQFWRVMAVQAAVLTLALLIPSLPGQEPERHLPLNEWLIWLGPALIFLVVQVGVEELVFRGYLQSQLAARVRSPLVWLGLPAVLFAVLHLDPTAGDNRWPVVGITLLFSLSAGDLTARTGTLAPAFALHLVNNIGALLIIGAKGPMQGLALYVLPVDMSDPSIVPALWAEALLILISWLGARLVLRV